MKPEIVSYGATSPRGSDREVGVFFWFASLTSSGPHPSPSHRRQRARWFVCWSSRPTPAVIPRWFASEVSGLVKTVERPAVIHQ